MRSSWKHISFYAIRILCCVGILLVYFYGWRPLRKQITQQYVRPKLEISSHSQKPPFIMKNEGVAINISFEWNNQIQQVRYQPQAGFFFLIALAALVFITLRLRWYFILLLFHIVATVITAGLMLESRQGWYFGFILTDFLVSYLVPGFSFAYVAIVYHLETQSAE